MLMLPAPAPVLMLNPGPMAPKVSGKDSSNSRWEASIKASIQDYFTHKPCERIVSPFAIGSHPMAHIRGYVNATN